MLITESLYQCVERSYSIGQQGWGMSLLKGIAPGQVHSGFSKTE